MGKITGKHLLCFLLLALPLSWAVDLKKDVRETENGTGWNQVKTRRLFARRKITPPQEGHIPQHHVTPLRKTAGSLTYNVKQKHKPNNVTPARRCSRLMESCSSHAPCCDPCASCRCRLFNTICHCWRMNPLCLNKT